MNNNFDPLTRAVRCEKCGEWWYQGASHRCKPTHQLDEAIRDRDRRIAELEAQIAELTYERDRAIAWLASVGIGLSFEVVSVDASNKDGEQ